MKQYFDLYLFEIQLNNASFEQSYIGHVTI
jgi:hypothetical protein